MSRRAKHRAQPAPDHLSLRERLRGFYYRLAFYYYRKRRP